MTSLLMFTLLVGACGVLLLPLISVVPATIDGTVFDHLHQYVGWFTWLEKTGEDSLLKAWIYFTTNNNSQPKYETRIYPVVVYEQNGILRFTVLELNLELYLNGTLHGWDSEAVSIGTYMLDSFSTVKVWFANDTARETARKSIPQEENFPQLRRHPATHPLPSYRVETTRGRQGRPILHIKVPLTLHPGRTEAPNGGIVVMRRWSDSLFTTRKVGSFIWRKAEEGVRREAAAAEEGGASAKLAAIEVTTSTLPTLPAGVYEVKNDVEHGWMVLADNDLEEGCDTPEFLYTLLLNGTLSRGDEEEDIGTYEWLSARDVRVNIKGNDDNDDGHGQQQNGYSVRRQVEKSDTLEKPWTTMVNLVLKVNEQPRH